jgi:nucleoside-diphosphate-sugar epimerase
LRILLTGATGYIGTNLARLLVDEQHSISALVRPGSNTDRIAGFVNCCTISPTMEDIPDVVENLAPDIAIHLASQQGKGAESITELLSTNIELGTRLLEALSNTTCKGFINTGSYWQYSENGKFLPNSLYAASKSAFQTILESYTACGKINSTTLVLYDVYGPGDWREKFLNVLLREAALNRSVPATSGKQIVGLCHISDVINGFHIAAKALSDCSATPVNDISFLLPERFLTLREVVNTMQSLTSAKLSVSWGEKRYDDGQIMAPFADGPVLNSWKPQLTLEEGLTSVLRACNMDVVPPLQPSSRQ